MTILESNQVLTPTAQRVESARSRPPRPVAPTILDTTELRWFVPGLLPRDVEAWFTGSTGVREERCDTYLLDGRVDVGVKHRFRELLEVKVLQSLDGCIDLGHGLAGPLEVWRKWSPVEALSADGSGGLPLDVCKSIVKRRFSIDGTEIPFSMDAQLTESGCDVEIASVTAGSLNAWTFAFAAFGPPSSRRDALLATWHALVAAAPCPEPFGPRTARAMGYPEWLAVMAGPSRRIDCQRVPAASISPAAMAAPTIPALLRN